MKAQIVKINPKTIIIKNEKDVFATVSKSKIDFEYKLGDIITLEKNGDEVYFLPGSTASFSAQNDFWDDTPVTEKNKKGTSNYDDGSITASIIVIVLAIVGWFIAFFPCLGGAVAALIYAFTHEKNLRPERKTLSCILIIIGITAWTAEILIAQSYGLF